MLFAVGAACFVAVCIGFALFALVFMAAADGEGGWALGFLVSGLILGIGGIVGLVKVDAEETRRDCKSQGEQYVAKTKVINGDCRYQDEKSGRWLDEDTWLYVTGLDSD